MPRGDRTGPAGWGPMTGRGMGYCAGYDAPGYASLAPGLGRGWGRGWWGGGGRGWRHRYYATPLSGAYAALPRWAPYDYPLGWAYGPYGPPVTEEQEVEVLKSQAEALRREMEAITKRLEELEPIGPLRGKKE